MATETNAAFPDLLSAALDQSGITDEDFDFSIPQSTSLSTSDYGSMPGTVSEDSETTNGSFDTFENDNQGDIFAHALRQLAATSHIKPKEVASPTPPPPPGSVPHQPMAMSTPLASVIQRPTNPTPPTMTYQITKTPGGQLSATLPQTKIITISRPGQQPIKIARVGQQPVLSKVGSVPHPVTQSGFGGHSMITQSKLGQQNFNLSGLKTLNLQQALLRHNSKIIVTTNNSSQFGDLSRLINTNTPIRVVSQSSLTGGNVKIGNSNSLVNSSHSSVVQPVSNGPIVANGNIFKPAPLTNKDVSRLWSTEDVKLKTFPSYAGMSSSGARVKEEDDEVEEEEVQELGRAETYSEYVPSKLRFGSKHPDSVVETSSLSSVVPQDIHYKLSIPEHILDNGELSALQLEAIVYASQRQETIMPNGERAGFLIGDGAGVGKGRTIAGLIYENYLLGRKRSIWFSVSNDLKIDAERDLRDIGAGKVEVHALNKFKYAKISSKENGSVKKGVIFATYSSLIGESQSGGKYRTRLKQLLHWCGEDFDGLIVFDECHKAKNLCPVGSSKPTKTGQTVLELQNRLPKAKVVYASATGASEPKNMAYMTRLGLWGIGTPFREFNDFIQAVERRGVGAMELVAMDMKLRGMYIARQLSFHGVTFRIEEIPLNKDFIKMYDEAVKLWVQARENFQTAADLIDAEQRMKKSMWGQFWSAHQRFFKYLCISSKVHHCVKLTREAVKNGKCVVIGLQSTGEARTLDQLEDNGGELNDFVSTAKGVIQTLIEKHFPAPDRRKTFDFFGMGSYSNPSSPIGKKRKKEQNNHNVAKKHRVSNGVMNSENSDGKESSSSESEFSDLSLSDSSDSSAEESDNFNPFGGGSDSDDDPWLKKKAVKKTKPKKEKKVKKKKPKKTKQNKENKEDEQFDRALEAAGLMKNNVPTPQSTSTPNYSNNNSCSVEHACHMKRDLLEKVERLGDLLPPNALDELIDELGGPENVAEMTGRKGRVVTNEDGTISYESRSEIDVPLEFLNLTEKQRFMDGEKNIAIISEAASSGISLQADRRVLNQRRRVHLTLELPWSADRAIQQFGRTHRSNQVTAPEYIFMISALAGERRFASTVAKRLESLGALTHGDRRATETRDLSRFNFDNKYGRTALESIMKSVLGFESPFVPPPSNYEGKFFEDARIALIGVGMVTIDERSKLPLLEKDYNSISKFLNRILGMTVAVQNALFMYFTDTLTAIILEAKRNGRWDMGIMDLGSGGESVRKLQTRTFVGDVKEGTAKTELHTMSVERGMNWNAMMVLWKRYTGPDDGLYMSTQVRNGKRTVVLAVMLVGNKKKDKLFSTYRPNTGLQPRFEPLADIKKKYKKVLPDEAQVWWDEQYESSLTVCSHAYWKGNCKKVTLGLPCEIGLRSRTYHVLSGSVLSVWTKVESVLASMPGGAHSKMQIIRLKTEDGLRIVGSLIPGNCVAALCNVLSKESTNIETQIHPGHRPSDVEASEVTQIHPGHHPSDVEASEVTQIHPGHRPSDAEASDALSMPMLF